MVETLLFGPTVCRIKVTILYIRTRRLLKEGYTKLSSMKLDIYVIISIASFQNSSDQKKIKFAYTLNYTILINFVRNMY